MSRFALIAVLLGTTLASGAAHAQQGSPALRKLMKLMSVQMGIEACGITVPPAAQAKLDAAGSEAAQAQTELTTQAQVQAAVGAMAEKITSDQENFCRNMKSQPIDQLIDAVVAE